MGYELAVYETEQRVVVHQPTCPAYSTVARHYYSGHVLHAHPDWSVITCSKCRPSIYVVRTTAHHITVHDDSDDDMTRVITDPKHPRYWTRKAFRWKPPQSWPPIGITALDITGSNIDVCQCGHSHHCHEPWCRECECDGWRQWAWWKLGNCRDDGRLGDWLRWLYVGDDVENQTHWAVTIMKVICDECQVRAECLEQGVWGREEWGVWGGATKTEREGLRKKWKREGRRDERFNAQRLGREDASRAAATSRSSNGRTGKTPRRSEAAGETVPEVPVGIEVRWPRTYPWTGERRGSASPGDW